MSSTILKAINMINEDKHTVGNLNNWNKSVVNGGALVTDDTIENFSIVELGFDANGERTCSYLKDAKTKGYLIASVEDYMEEYEDIANFFNIKGERGRIVVLEPMITRFEVSNFKMADTAKEAKKIANNMKVHWDATQKTYLVSNGTSEHSDYATAGNQFVVVCSDAGSLDGQALIRLEVIK